MFKYKLLELKKDIDQHRSIDISKLVSTRLDKTLKAYVEQLEHSYNNLLRRNSLKILKKLSEEE